MDKGKPEGYTGNRWEMENPVTVSFMCPSKFRDRMKRTAKARKMSVSEFIRESIERNL